MNNQEMNKFYDELQFVRLKRERARLWSARIRLVRDVLVMLLVLGVVGLGVYFLRKYR